MKIIEITIDTTGQSTVQTTGFTGSSCRDASRFIEQALGERASETLTAEFYQDDAVRQEQSTQQG